ncbi:11 kDa late embryogenesis abundant protein-like [Phoenix dactylifera]|uniref:11 kDa late embryogenesis abundant protein-like n=1 Tax=Phoenix dactylifera TaxID=42345 RepID=A0A8B8ZKA5_PHODC|nr:11 kDa late embryogenesis abundant protein-like [Phoenix dactylifera]
MERGKGTKMHPVMQTGKSAMAATKEKVGNVAASAKAGMEKTKAAAEEKIEKMKTRDPAQKGAAEQLKEERIEEAEVEKQASKEENAAVRDQIRASAAGTVAGYPSGQTGVVIRHHHS